MYRKQGGALSVLLAHPGGPYWARKDVGAWSIPKGEFDPGEEPEAAALREFEEELGVRPRGALVPLGEIMQKGGKRVIAFALEGELDATTITSNLCEIEWPPKSGRTISIPEVDRAAWFTIEEARQKLRPAQVPLLDRLVERVGDAQARAAPKHR
jgi:predicted NUDIX family NTP pyrophosphohydrolase